MKLKIRVILFVLLCFGLSAMIIGNTENDVYTNEIDSLESLLTSENIEDRERVDVLYELSRSYGYSSPEKSLAYGAEALELAKKIDYGIGEALALKAIGIAHHFMDEYDQAMDYYEKSLKVSQDIDYKLGVATGYHNIGAIYDYRGLYDKALENFLIALKLLEEIDDKKGKAYALISIGNIYRTQNKYDKALQYYLESLEMNKQLKLGNEIAYSLYNIGSIYEFTNDDEKALKYYTESMQIQEQINEKYGLVTSYRIIGNIHERRSELDTALYCYNKSLEIAKETKNRRGIIEASMAIGTLNIQQGNYNKAVPYMDEALEIAQEIGAKDLLMTCYKWNSELNYLKENNKEAYQYYKLYTELKDSIFNEEKHQQILRMQTVFETEKKEKENELLKVKEARNLLTIKKQRIIALSTSIGFLLVLALVIIVYRSNVLNKRANNLLLEKNIEIGNQKEELTATLENLEQTQNQLIQTAKMASLGQLTAGVAHELNNPINFIHGNISPLERDIKELISVLDKYESLIESMNLQNEFSDVAQLKEKLDFKYLIAEIHKLLHGMEEGAHRTSEIVKGLRNFSRIEDDQCVMADIHKVMDSTLTILENELKNRIVVHKEYGDLGIIECIPTKLGQVFMNILTNCKQAIENDGEILISTFRLDEKLIIKIKDTGHGMSEEVIKHIFEPFYTTRDVGKGTGLGLSISFGIIEGHNGDINVISEPGNGTEISIQLPISQT